MPHVQCYLGVPWLVWLHAFSDGLIALATGLARVDADELATVRHATEMRVGEHVFLEVSATGRVLVVDDEETVRLVAARMLEAIGFTVDLAVDGREALARFALNPAAYVLVLLDLTMPQLDGAETFRRLRQVHPSVRVVLMSGFSEPEATGAFAGKGLAGYLQKPFNTGRFVAAMREFLSR